MKGQARRHRINWTDILWAVIALTAVTTMFTLTMLILTGVVQ